MSREARVAELLAKVRNLFRRGGVGHDTIWAAAYEGMAVVSGLAGFVIIVRGLGLARYLGYAALYAIVGTLGAPAYGGLILAVLQHGVREQEDLQMLSSSAMTLSLAAGEFMGALAMLIAYKIVHGVSAVAIALIIVAEMILVPAINVVSATIQAHGRFPLAMQLRIAPMLLRIVGLIALYIAGRVTLVGVGICLVAGYLVVIGAAAVVSRRVLGFTIRPGVLMWRHVRTTFGYGLGIAGLTAQNDGDKAVLSAYSPTAAIARAKWDADGSLYSIAYRIVQFGFLPVNGLIAATHVRFLHAEDATSRGQTRKAARLSLLVLAYGALFSLGIWLAAPLIPIVLGEKYRGSLVMMKWLSPLVAFRSMAMFALNGLMGLGHVTLRTVLLVFGAVLSLAMYIALIPSMSWRGAVWGTLISESVLAATTWTALIVLERRAAQRALVTIPDALSIEMT
jgi:O-antigen/teichoic acid export membrane protein